MKPAAKPQPSAEERAAEEALRRRHAANPLQKRPPGVVGQRSFAAVLSLMARFKSLREQQGLSLADVAERMGIDAPALSRLETGKMLSFVGLWSFKSLGSDEYGGFRKDDQEEQ